MKYLKLALLVVLTVVVSIGFADSLKDVSKSLATKYKAMDAAYRKGDIGPLENMFDEHCKFKMKGEGQSLTKPLFLSGTKALFKMRSIKKCETKLLSVTKTKDGGYLATSHWSGETVESKSGRPMKGTDQTLYDTWKKTKEGWVIMDRLIEQK